MPTDTACQLIGFSVFPLGPRGQCLEVFAGRAVCSREILLLPGAIRLSGRSGTATTVETFTQHPAFSGPQLCLVPEFTPALTQLLQASVQVGEGVYFQTASCSNFTPVLTSAPSWGSRARMVFFPSGFTPTVGCSFLWLAKASPILLTSLVYWCFLSHSFTTMHFCLFYYFMKVGFSGKWKSIPVLSLTCLIGNPAPRLFNYCWAFLLTSPEIALVSHQ